MMALGFLAHLFVRIWPHFTHDDNGPIVFPWWEEVRQGETFLFVIEDRRILPCYPYLQPVVFIRQQFVDVIPTQVQFRSTLYAQVILRCLQSHWWEQSMWCWIRATRGIQEHGESRQAHYDQEGCWHSGRANAQMPGDESAEITTIATR